VRALRDRLAPFDVVQLACVGVAVALALYVGTAVAKAGGMPPLWTIALVTAAGAAFLLSLPAGWLFLSWFVVAPLVQESASYNSVGHTLGLALYFGPSLLFGIWTLTRRPRELSLTFVDALPLGFLLYVWGAMVVSGDLDATNVKGVYVTVGIGVVLYYFFAIGPIASLSESRITAAILVVTIGEGGMSIADGITGWNLWHDTAWQSGESRAVATLANPSILGTLLGMGIVLATSVLTWERPARLRSLSIVTLAIAFPGLYFTLTRGPILATVVGVIFVLMTRTRTRIFAFAVLIVAAVALTVSWGRLTSSTVYQERVRNSGNVQVRLALERWSWKLAEKKPFFGHGYDSFFQAKTAAGFSAEDLQQFGTSSTSHNTYLTVLVDYGSIGLLLLLIPWVVVPWRALRNVALRPDLRWFVFGAVAAVLLYFISRNTGDAKVFSYVPAVPWVLLGLLRRRQLAED
jgi:O-antigen ligase